ncbi:STIP1 [Mytilus edulis]|uniref:STIP1 n=1 Tax=Mytilus edulis TaxID=6550 RepID=A0A8S3R4J0_MYTED|nr:STIP1 [Mytilus edulis]
MHVQNLLQSRSLCWRMKDLLFRIVCQQFCHYSLKTLLTDETEMLRMKGNEAFKDNRYHDAIQYYSEGIRFSKEDLVDVRLFSNRSLMYLKINDYENALKDAEKCIILAPTQWKAHCWKAYAMANLVKNGDLPAEFEKKCPNRSHLDAIATFYRCKISNGWKGCDDFPKCNGGSGCVTNTGECNREGKNQGFANFASGQVGYPGIWVGSGGKLIVQNCVLDRCGGGGVLADGNKACLEIRHCTIQNMRQMGVEARNGGMVKVEDNVIIDNQFHGIAIAPRGYAVISRNLIQGNGQEGIFCGGMLNPNSSHMLEMKSDETSQAIITKNTIIQNGLSGMSLDGGTYEVSGNKIIDNWLWGMMIKSRSSVYIVGNDIFENKCGGIRIGTNYSASVIIDGNTIRDHTGPDIFAINSSEIGYKDNVKTEIETMFANMQFAEERLEYSRPPIITNRNIRRNNNTGVNTPKKQFK